MFRRPLRRNRPLAGLVTSVLLMPAARAGAYPPEVGRPHPQIVLRAIDQGRPVALSHFRNRKVLLIHLASWSAGCREHVPVWHEKTRQLVAENKLAILGIAQEQHPDRCRLFAQWKNIDWPILHDPLNLLGVDRVPLLVAVDEYGIVRAAGGDLDAILESFVAQTYPKPRKLPMIGSDKLPDPRWTRREARLSRTAEDLRAHGDALVLAGLPAQIDEAIETYGRAIEIAGKEGWQDAEAYFRLGVAYRLRYDGPRRKPGDFQAAVDAWHRALALQPNRYIFRRRIQQYGPRLDKPCAFYDWVAQARRDLRARGETPVRLAVEPAGTELIGKEHRPATERPELPEGDPQGQVNRDKKGLIRIEPTVVRGTGKKRRHTFQVYLTFRPNADKDAHWSNEAEPLRVWIDQPKGTRLSPAFIEHARAPQPVSDEARTVSFEVRLSRKKKGTTTLKGYALYNTCEGRQGKCQFLRQDVMVKIKVK